MRFFIALGFALFTCANVAQAQQDSLFKSYSDYAAFVDQNIMQRNFIPLILRLGGRDEFTSQQLEANNASLRQVWPQNFNHSGVFRREELGGGVSQEGRIYWNGVSYAYFYALLHQREDSIVVLTFNLNSSSKEILGRF